VGQARVHRGLPRIEGTETAAALAERLATRASTGAGVVPVHEVLAGLFPSGGLERGQIYGIRGGASMSLLYALVADATRDGAWFAMVDMPRAGLVAAEQYGVAMHRLLCVGFGEDSAWGSVVGALVDGIDLVATASPRCTPAESRRIAARARASGTVLIVVGAPGGFEIDATLSVVAQRWQFDAHAVSREVTVQCSGRRIHPGRSTAAHLPDPHGRLGPVPP